MKRRFFARALAVALCCLFLGSTTTASTPRPITGTWEGSGFFFSGHFAHLGLVSGEITNFNGVDTTEATWTSANGDAVFIRSVFAITGFNSASGLFIFEQDITVLGGTGRFEGASGSIAGAGETAADFSTYFGAIDGTIEY